MHIVIANQWYPPESGWGGVAMYNHAVARAYRQLGHAVTILARRNHQETLQFAEIDGIRIWRLLTRDHYYWRRAPLVGFYTRTIQQLAYSLRVKQLLQRIHREQSIDVVEFAEVNAEGFFLRVPPTPPL